MPRLPSGAIVFLDMFFLDQMSSYSLHFTSGSGRRSAASGSITDSTQSLFVNVDVVLRALL
jgi:hypothetical protein